MGIYNSTKEIFGVSFLGWLGVVLIALFLAISVLAVIACSYVHWLLAAIVGCVFGVIWTFTIAVGVYGWQKKKRYSSNKR